MDGRGEGRAGAADCRTLPQLGAIAGAPHLCERKLRAVSRLLRANPTVPDSLPPCRNATAVCPERLKDRERDDRARCR